MKNTIAVDLDDVLANTADHLDRYYNARFGTNIKLQDHQTYKLNDIWNRTLSEVIDITDDFFQSEEGKNITPFEGAEYAIDELATKYNLIVLTSRDLDLKNETKEWVDKYFPDKFKEIVMTNKLSKNHIPSREKYEVCLEKNIKIMVEDNLHYALQNANYDIMTYLMDRPWNQIEDLPNTVKRVYSWKEILDEL